MLIIFRRGCKNCILPHHNVILMRKILGWKNLKVFLKWIWDFQWNFFGSLFWKFSVGLLQLQSTCSYDFSLREKVFVWNFYFFIISDSDRKNIELRQSIFGGVVKTAFYVCIRTFWQKLFSFWERYKLLSLSDLQRNFFRILSKIIGEVLKTAIYVSN